MDYLTSPALLGGIMACIALSAWTIGRWQGAAALTRETLGAPSPSYSPPRLAQPCEALATAAALPTLTEARTERRGTLGQTVSLTDLHAEVSAYRRQEQIFASFAEDAFRIGQPICTVHLAAMATCGCEQQPRNLAPLALVAEAAPQPSLGFGPFTLV